MVIGLVLCILSAMSPKLHREPIWPRMPQGARLSGVALPGLPTAQKQG
jgi:hypothetical protein